MENIFSTFGDVLNWFINVIPNYLNSFIDLLELVPDYVNDLTYTITPFGTIMTTVYNSIPNIYTSGFILFIVIIIVVLLIKEYL